MLKPYMDIVVSKGPKCRMKTNINFLPSDSLQTAYHLLWFQVETVNWSKRLQEAKGRTNKMARSITTTFRGTCLQLYHDILRCSQCLAQFAQLPLLWQPLEENEDLQRAEENNTGHLQHACNLPLTEEGAERNRQEHRKFRKYWHYHLLICKFWAQLLWANGCLWNHCRCHTWNLFWPSIIYLKYENKF